MIEKYEKYRRHLDFKGQYMAATNAASGSTRDANANVEQKNVTTLTGEETKDDMIGINRLQMIDKLKELFDIDIAKEYIRQLEEHETYKHDETHPNYPYCVSITMYPFLFFGLKPIGGHSSAPQNLESFSGSFINLIFAVSSQFAGAVAAPEFLTYMDYFIRKEYGDDYIDRIDDVVDLSSRKRTIDKVITSRFDQIIYSINTPAAARHFQSVFFNIAYFDKYFFDGIFKDFVFPDGSKPIWRTVSWLQKRFIRWFADERFKEYLTFPVETLSLMDNGVKFLDDDWYNYYCEMCAEGHSPFLYHSKTVDSLSSCCRLRNNMVENTFSYTLGAGGVATGSKCVITININRLVQNATRDGVAISEAVKIQVEKIHKYLIAYNAILEDYLKANMLSIYEAGYIQMSKQYLTIGINGFVEGAQFLGIKISDNEEYKMYAEQILRPIYEANKAAKTKDIMFNTEFVPAESLGSKFAKWDKRDGYFVPRDLYNSYFYIVEDPHTDIITKIKLHGDDFTRYLDGGSAGHFNFEELLDKEQYRQIGLLAVKYGCPYFTYNTPASKCKSCGHTVKYPVHKCPKCGCSDMDYYVRIIGYHKKIASFPIARQEEEKRRHYENVKISGVFDRLQ